MKTTSNPSRTGLNASDEWATTSATDGDDRASQPHDRALITFVLPYYGVGGAEKQLANLIAYRPNYARTVRVSTITFLPAESNHVRSRFEAGGATNTLIDRSRLSFPQFFLRLVWSLMKSRPAIVSTFLDGSTGTWGRLAAILTFVPAIVHSDRTISVAVEPSHQKLRAFLNRRTARFLPNAHAIAEELTASGVPAEKIRVMWNGVDLSVFNGEGPPPSWRSQSNGTVLGYLGRFHPVKRVDLLLQALLELQERHRPSLVVLAGDGQEMPRIRKMVEVDPWLKEHCRLLGTIDDTAGFLRGIDYLVLPSESEGLPNVVLEAMAMSKPVVSTRVSDIPNLVADTGLLVDAGNLEQLTEALHTMQTMPSEKRLEMGRMARKRVEQHFSIEAAAKRFWDAHLELLRSSR